ncbi:BZ3500_MvSof-1268-A1-R1_Chr3-1g06039 [Microbotryum saponariae]|uniref:BZ3500_MvSof-1268-A1-R1_Chr3-1g06039 protein n=1 Tax=Microbotryum saponariae TaxID=289078 RepID=A0A2X0L3P3_9BASI|nr:BZ3500_MvSof-1268-A1-R1_Chr3-1g06039 [Microbotryum saponariae]SDA03849.1 BZ3501_MvSof-1269-A2-R1_Chr3-2g05724 [Microbotryum saponariae]
MAYHLDNIDNTHSVTEAQYGSEALHQLTNTAVSPQSSRSLHLQRPYQLSGASAPLIGLHLYANKRNVDFSLDEEGRGVVLDRELSFAHEPPSSYR